jgi:glycolate oxidase FAD binding subunit
MRAPEAVRASVDVFQPQASALSALSNRVKESFDPAHLFNPGRMYRGI